MTCARDQDPQESARANARACVRACMPASRPACLPATCPHACMPTCLSACRPRALTMPPDYDDRADAGGRAGRWLGAEVNMQTTGRGTCPALQNSRGAVRGERGGVARRGEVDTPPPPSLAPFFFSAAASPPSVRPWVFWGGLGGMLGRVFDGFEGVWEEMYTKIM